MCTYSSCKQHSSCYRGQYLEGEYPYYDNLFAPHPMNPSVSCINFLAINPANRLHKAGVQLIMIQEMFSDALQSDLEHGVKSLNEKASKEFHEKYPQLSLALQRLADLELPD